MIQLYQPNAKFDDGLEEIVFFSALLKKVAID